MHTLRRGSSRQGDEAALIVGRQDTVHLRADDVSCVDSIMLKDPAGKELKTEWKRSKPDEVEVKLPLQESQPGAMTLLVAQFGLAQPQPLNVQSFAEAGRFDGFEIHAGDAQGVLTGSRLDEVASLTLKNIVFMPQDLSRHPGGDELPMTAKDDADLADLKPEHAAPAKVTLKDGRVMPVTATVDAARPKVALIGKSVQASALSGDSNILLTDPSELPQDATLVFSVKAQIPSSFGREETIDVATVDDAFDASLSLTNGGLALENSHVAVATFTPAKAFGASAYGPLKYRVNTKGASGDWQPLANLVRLPMLKQLDCPATPELACKLTGSSLYLIDSVSADAEFGKPVTVPDGFLGSTMPVPHPRSGTLYLKLRDNPQIVNPSALSVQNLPPAPAETTAPRHVSRPLAAISDPCGLAARALQRTARHHADLGGNPHHRLERVSECARFAALRIEGKIRPRLDDHHHLVHPVRPRDLYFVMRRKAGPGQDQLLDLRGKQVHTANDQHVVGASRDLGKSAHGGDVARKKTRQVAGAITHHRHGLLGERGEHEFPGLTRSDRLAALGVDDLRQEVVLPDRGTFLGAGELLRNARPHHLGQAVDVAGIDAERGLDLLSDALAPRLCAEQADGQSARLGIDPPAPEFVQNREHVARRDHDDVRAEVHDELHLPLRLPP
jgi:hypothetical protein